MISTRHFEYIVHYILCIVKLNTCHTCITTTSQWKIIKQLLITLTTRTYLLEKITFLNVIISLSVEMHVSKHLYNKLTQRRWFFRKFSMYWLNEWWYRTFIYFGSLEILDVNYQLHTYVMVTLPFSPFHWSIKHSLKEYTCKTCILVKVRFLAQKIYTFCSFWIK